MPLLKNGRILYISIGTCLLKILELYRPRLTLNRKREQNSNLLGLQLNQYFFSIAKKLSCFAVKNLNRTYEIFYPIGNAIVTYRFKNGCIYINDR